MPKLKRASIQFSKGLRFAETTSSTGQHESPESEQQLELLSLASTLNHYHPGQYEELLRPFIESKKADEG